MPSVYLASPLGFAASTRAFMDDLAARLRRHVEVHNPWDEEAYGAEFSELGAVDHFPDRQRRLADLNHRIGHANRIAIEATDALFAVLDGVDVDSGTASEIGYAFALGRPIWGLRTDFRLAGDNHGAVVNLQVEYFIRESGGDIVDSAEQLVRVAARFADGHVAEDSRGDA